MNLEFKSAIAPSTPSTIAPRIKLKAIALLSKAKGQSRDYSSSDMGDRPTNFIAIAQRTLRIVWQNIAIAMFAKVVFIGLGAIGIATLWEAVFADVGVALLAILNAGRILK